MQLFIEKSEIYRSEYADEPWWNFIAFKLDIHFGCIINRIFYDTGAEDFLEFQY